MNLRELLAQARFWIGIERHYAAMPRTSPEDDEHRNYACGQIGEIHPLLLGRKATASDGAELLKYLRWAIDIAIADYDESGRDFSPGDDLVRLIQKTGSDLRGLVA